MFYQNLFAKICRFTKIYFRNLCRFTKIFLAKICRFTKIFPVGKEKNARISRENILAAFII